MRLAAYCWGALCVALPTFLVLSTGLDPVSANALECAPPVDIVQTPALAPNSTLFSDGEPPARFRQMPEGHIKVMFGQDAINAVCGVPPCGKRFLGCVRNDVMVLPDPNSPDFAKITRHEIAHFNGWPATHGS